MVVGRLEDGLRVVFCSFSSMPEREEADIWRQMAATDDEGAIWRRHGLRGKALGFNLFAGFCMSWHALDLVHCCREDEDGTGEVLGLLAHSSSIANLSLQEPSDFFRRLRYRRTGFQSNFLGKPPVSLYFSIFDRERGFCSLLHWTPEMADVWMFESWRTGLT